MIYSHKNTKIVFSNNIVEDIKNFKSERKGKIFVITDCNTNIKCLPLLDNVLDNESPVFTIKDGEKNKNIENVVKVWNFLSNNSADRSSILLNIGGGVLCDTAGFAASTFKRGISFANIPTTLLSQVDASVGGKTGINFNDLKNEIGTFAFPCRVFINTVFLRTLDKEHILSGFAEMIKHALIHSEDYLTDLQSINPATDYDGDFMLQLIKKSVDIKNEIVIADPTEKSIRKALNFGHTAGHAFESFFLDTSKHLLHGYAVAQGMIIELYLSHLKLGFPYDKFKNFKNFIQTLYGKLLVDGSDYDKLYELMTHDKKNEAGRLNVTLLEDVGKVLINQQISKNDFFDALSVCGV